ncbi:NAD-dependent succinate-semialdehyde dehydrogenase [Rhodococcus opacus]|uniref:NAD-dependent succinate-semialdehyde dehydrogenase n=1 Tax=Rhodococcus opacus TaxID=37919 RepID=UPI0029490410|nr:NAD-dependent succinate-semialdehyde dehydrogenase [Rhodococcus opacus]MDV6246686.1 NAD-dependent succinate-semialdehyde dehydrogenase [Rhodococcus opacus]
MAKYTTINPATGELIQEFNTVADAAAREAVAASAAAYQHWREGGIDVRSAVLQRVADALRAQSDELAELMTLEVGKPIGQALAEVALSASIFEYYATTGPDLIADEELDIAGEGRAVVRTAPIGPLLGIMPWNFPLYQAARFIAPNLLLGNTVLLKHASNCPQQAIRIEQVITEAGAPAGVYQNLLISGAQASALVDDPRIQGVSLTGSERAGIAVGEAAGRNLKKCVLELGGSDPFLVLPGADVARAVGAAVPGRFWNAGQTCTSSKRFIIHSSLWNAFVEQFLSEATSWPAGDPAKSDTKLGPMASVSGRDEVAEQVDDAVAKGAVVHLGGKVPNGPGAYYPATVLSAVTPDMRAYYEELFGPVAVLHKVDSVDEAIALANDTPFGLGSAVFTEDDELAQQVVDRLDVGMVGINATVKSAPDLPFGGVKSSGIGRELGRFGLDEFSNKKLIRSF